MSHGARWRDSCASTRRDSECRWLWRLVGPGFDCGHGSVVFFRNQRVIRQIRITEALHLFSKKSTAQIAKTRRRANPQNYFQGFDAILQLSRFILSARQPKIAKRAKLQVHACDRKIHKAKQQVHGLKSFARKPFEEKPNVKDEPRPQPAPEAAPQPKCRMWSLALAPCWTFFSLSWRCGHRAILCEFLWLKTSKREEHLTNVEESGSIVSSEGLAVE